MEGLVGKLQEVISNIANYEYVRQSHGVFVRINNGDMKLLLWDDGLASYFGSGIAFPLRTRPDGSYSIDGNVYYANHSSSDATLRKVSIISTSSVITLFPGLTINILNFKLPYE